MAKPVIPDWGSDDDGSSEYGSEDVYEVERIIAERTSKGAKQYLVKWAGFGEEQCTWEPADSFDQPLSITLWEEARERGDVLDETELQDVEAKMARYKEEEEKKEAIPPLPRVQKLVTVSSAQTNAVRKNSTDLQHPDRGTSSIAKPKSVATTQISSKPTPKPKPPVPVPVEPAPMAGSVKPRQEFHGITDRPQTARRTTGLQSNTSAATSHYPRNQEGKRYRNLSHQNNDQKRRRQEPPPNLGQVGAKLRPATELAPSATYDVALNLPSGPPRLPLARSTIQEPSVESPTGQFERLPKPEEANASFPTIHESYRPQHQLSQPIRDSNSSRGTGMRCVRKNGEEFWHRFPGQAVVQLYWQSREIGTVIVDLPNHMIAALIKTKQSSELHMQFEQEDDCDVQDFDAFKRSKSSAFHTTGFIEPYDISRGQLNELLTFLGQYPKTAGVWRHESIPWILVAYSSTAATFSAKGFPAFPGQLGLVACKTPPWRNTSNIFSKILDFSTDGHRMSDGDAVPEFGHDMIPSKPPSKEERRHAAVAVAAVGGVEGKSSEVQNNNKSDVPMARNTTQTVKRRDITMDEQKDLTVRQKEHTFEERYGITYEHLTRIPASVKANGSGKGKFNHHTARFFLAFGEDKKDEEAELTAWLRAHTPAHRVLSASEAHNWDAYKEAMLYADHVGVILIHEDYMSQALGIMTGLAKRIRREDLQLFRVSLGPPLYDLSLRHFVRIFPGGLCLAITEGFMISQPQNTTTILDWFAKNRRKNYKILLRPLPEQFLREICEDVTLSNDDFNSHQQSLLHLRTLRGAFETTASPMVRSDDENESSSYILSPLSLPVYSKGDTEASLVTKDNKKIAERDGKLLDFFGGWSFNQLGRFRKFVALAENPPKSVVNRSNHVDFFSEDFIAVYNIRKPAASMPRESLISPMSPMLDKSPVMK